MKRFSRWVIMKMFLVKKLMQTLATQGDWISARRNPPIQYNYFDSARETILSLWDKLHMRERFYHKNNHME